MPNLPIISNNDSTCLLLWHIDNASEIDRLLREIIFLDSVLVLFVLDQVEEVTSTVMGTRSESHIIIPPIDASDLTIMALDVPVSRNFASVEVIHVDIVTSTYRGSKKMTTIAELDLSALFDCYTAIFLDTVGEDIHHLNLVSDSH